MGSKMFDRYPQPEGYIPDNRPRCHEPSVVEIMAGETTVHTFEVPFPIDETVRDFKAIYKLGLEVVLELPYDRCEVLYDSRRMLSILTWTLTPEETNLFRNTCLSAQVQVKFDMSDGSTLYTEIVNIQLEDSLDN